LSNADPPQSIFIDIPGEPFILKHLEWQAAPYFTVMLISKDLSIVSCFCAPFATNMGRVALVVDIPIANNDRSTPARECLRLCTTHLESLWDANGCRPNQLALISAILKGNPPSTYKIAAGLVGGDMNSIDKTEHELHKREDIDLKDAWEDVPAPPIPKLKPFQRDPTYGRARGNTWGYQSSAKSRKRLDKFLYTGKLETVPLEEFDDTTSRLSRLGLGLKTEVDAWEWIVSPWTVKGEKLVNKPVKEYLPLDFFPSDRVQSLLEQKELTRVKHVCWVSDYFSIAIGIRVS
jgi:tyrosyl-DNA phosphodiesterase 2